jgi:hypothetical protein
VEECRFLTDLARRSRPRRRPLERGLPLDAAPDAPRRSCGSPRRARSGRQLTRIQARAPRLEGDLERRREDRGAARAADLTASPLPSCQIRRCVARQSKRGSWFAAAVLGSTATARPPRRRPREGLSHRSSADDRTFRFRTLLLPWARIASLAKSAASISRGGGARSDALRGRPLRGRNRISVAVRERSAI